MATPTNLQLRDLALVWWREPGKPKLDVLASRIAAMWTDGNAIVRLRIENNAGVYSLVAELERNGTIVTRTWTPTLGERQETLADVYDPTRGGRTMREDGAA